MVRDIVRASVSGLEQVDIARKKRNWNKHSQMWWGEALVSEPTLRRFWARVRITRDNFDGICRAVGVDPQDIYELEEDNISLPEMDLAVLDEGWVGRDDLLADLATKLQTSRRIVLLLGITGIGKTALAESLVVRMRGNWIELRENCESETSNRDFATAARQWLDRCGERIDSEQLNPQQLLNRLVDRLCQQRHLILIDSLEYLLSGDEEGGWGDFQDPWWGKFFVNLLAQPQCFSRIILTSQDFPVRLQTECSRYDNFWHQQVLKGLDIEEQEHLFRKAELSFESFARTPLELIGEVYAGHPLALRVIAGEINQSWHGNVDKYWQDNSKYILEVKEALDAAAADPALVEGKADRWKLDSYTVALRRRVKERVECSFNRLLADVPDAYRLICIASIYRREIAEAAWLTHLDFEGYSLERQQNAMQSLKDRFLVEDAGIDSQDRFLVAQHNLIRSVAIARRIDLFGE